MDNFTISDRATGRITNTNALRNFLENTNLTIKRGYLEFTLCDEKKEVLATLDISEYGIKVYTCPHFKIRAIKVFSDFAYHYNDIKVEVIIR